MRVEFTQDWDIFPHEIIRAGATGTLCEIDESGMWIKIDTLYRNEIIKSKVLYIKVH